MIPIGMVCRAWITSPDGTRIYAKDYGKRAFCFFPRKKKGKKKPAIVRQVSQVTS